jgi:hypothetical protein
VNEVNGTDLNDLLGGLGFVRGTGFEGEVWTNPNSEWMSQVWIYFSHFEGGGWSWNAANGFDLAKFFRWWEGVFQYKHHINT